MFTSTSFTTTDVMKAAGVNQAQLSNWLTSAAKDTLNGSNIVSAGVKGKEREFSFFALMTIAATKVLTDLGLPPKRAFALAARFGHTDDINSGNHVRELGLPCHPNHGETYVITNGTHSAIVLRGKNEGIESAFKRAGLFGEHTCPGRITLNLSMLFENAMNTLGHDPDDILDAAYPKEAS